MNFCRLILLGTAVFLAGCGEKQILKNAHAKISSTLTDPLSAQFRNEEVTSDGSIACGEFNAKNRMGGYVGFNLDVFLKGGVALTSQAGPGFREFFRVKHYADTYKDDTFKNAYFKLGLECILVSEWHNNCPADMRKDVDNLVSDCAEFRKKDIKDLDALQSKLGISFPDS